MSQSLILLMIFVILKITNRSDSISRNIRRLKERANAETGNN